MSEQWAEVDSEVLNAMEVGGTWFLQRGTDAGVRFEWPTELRPKQLNKGAKHVVKIVQGHVVQVASSKGKNPQSRALPDGPPMPVHVGPSGAAAPRVAAQPPAAAQRQGAAPRGGAQQRPEPREADPADGERGFINPYNFIPFGTRFPERGAPSGHDTYAQGRFCGSLPVTITATTPLLLMDQSRAEAHPEWDKHKVLPLRTGPDKAPILPASSVKGMLRSSFEAVTNSRMGVFDTQKRYAMREQPKAALRKRPAVVADVAGRLVLRVVRQADVPYRYLSGAGAPATPVGAPWPPNNDAHNNVVRIVPAVMLPFTGNRLLAHLGGGFANRTPADRDEAFAWVHLMYHAPKTQRQQGFYAWVVSDLADSEAALGGPTAIQGRCARSYEDCQYTAKIRGVLHITGSRFVTNKQEKHDERMVPLESLDAKIDLGGIDELELGTPHDPLVPSGALADAWGAVIDAYVAASRDDVPANHVPGTYRRDRFPQEWRLKPGRTVFVDVGSLGHGAALTDPGDVSGLSPALVGRAAFPNTPADLVADELLPLSAVAADQPSDAQRAALTSPADRVFGWVAGKHAYRGHVRIDPPTVESDTPAGEGGDPSWPVTEFDPPLELAALGEPKPTQFRFYVDDPGKPKEPQSGYRKGARGLRGRKVYPHQKQWDVAPGWEQTNPLARGRWVYAGSQHSQTRSIRGWVNKGATFTTTLRFDNLDRFELGALLFLVTLGEGMTAKIGMGKPLGFGSITVAATLADAQVLDDEAVRTRYAMGSPEYQGVDQLQRLASEFRVAAGTANPDVIEAFEAAATGFTGVVDYPWTTRPAQAEGFVWFVENERGAQTQLPLITEVSTHALPRNPNPGDGEARGGHGPRRGGGRPPGGGAGRGAGRGRSGAQQAPNPRGGRPSNTAAPGGGAAPQPGGASPANPTAGRPATNPTVPTPGTIRRPDQKPPAG